MRFAQKVIFLSGWLALSLDGGGRAEAAPGPLVVVKHEPVDSPHGRLLADAASQEVVRLFDLFPPTIGKFHLRALDQIGGQPTGQYADDSGTTISLFYAMGMGDPCNDPDTRMSIRIGAKQGCIYPGLKEHSVMVTWPEGHASPAITQDGGDSPAARRRVVQAAVDADAWIVGLARGKIAAAQLAAARKLTMRLESEMRTRWAAMDAGQTEHTLTLRQSSRELAEPRDPAAWVKQALAGIK